MCQKQFWSWKSGSLLPLLKSPTFCSHIPKNKTSCALNGCHFPIWKHCCLFLERTQKSSVQQPRFSHLLSEIKCFKSRHWRSTVRRKTAIRQFGFGVGFSLKNKCFFPAEALWKCFAPSCGLLCSELPEVPVPRCSWGIFLFILPSLAEFFMCASLELFALLWGSSVAGGESKQGLRRFLCLGFV